MRSLLHLDRYRMRTADILAAHGNFGDEYNGMFLMPSPMDKRAMKILASNGEGWDHVSVSRMDRIPYWTEMNYVKDLFFYEEEVVMQLHVPKAMHVNYHPRCLHLWRPQNVVIPLPPTEMTGPLGVSMA